MVRIPERFADRLDAVGSPRPRLPPALNVRDAAVVALLMPGTGAREHDPTVVLIERNGQMRSHAGQVAFPGGKPDHDDASLAATALREASEEVGLPGDGAEVLGRLAPVPTPTGFCIWPFVAWAPSGWQPTNTSEGWGTWRGFEYEMHRFAVHEPPVWGATARIMWDLLERIRR